MALSLKGHHAESDPRTNDTAMRSFEPTSEPGTIWTPTEGLVARARLPDWLDGGWQANGLCSDMRWPFWRSRRHGWSFGLAGLVARFWAANRNSR